MKKSVTNLFVLKSEYAFMENKDDARNNPNGFLEGSLISFSETLSKRMNIRNEMLKPGNGYVVVEHLEEHIGVDITFVRVITDEGFVGWTLSDCPSRPGDDEW